jgi:hypothetical protein
MEEYQEGDGRKLVVLNGIIYDSVKCRILG